MPGKARQLAHVNRVSRWTSAHIGFTLLLGALLAAPASSAFPGASSGSAVGSSSGVSAGVDDSEPGFNELSTDRWQRFLRASRGRYQALAEKAGAIQTQQLEDCVEAQLSLTERRECLRTDVFARVAMERDGMALEEYVAVLHWTVAELARSPVNAAQRGQFQRLRAEWWPVWQTASQ